jgi:hypothetical protein
VNASNNREADVAEKSHADCVASLRCVLQRGADHRATCKKGRYVSWVKEPVENEGDRMEAA